jgi:cation:H+ antiporter
MLIELVLLAVGIGFLVKGSDLLVDAAEKLAVAAGVPVMIIGLTVVAAGTSVPELVVDVGAVLSGVGEIALGDIVGSNIADICLVLGAAALASPIKVHPSTARRDIPLIFVVAVLFLALALDGTLSRLDGAILLAAAAGYFFLVLRNLRKRGDGVVEPRRPGLRDLAMLGAGVAAVVIGARVTVDAAVGLAVAFGVQPYLIALTLIAIGTSLPELATSLAASRRGSGDLILGNNLGSFCFNALFIGGLCAVISPISVPGVFDIVVMTIAAALLVPLVLRGHVLDRQEGIFLLAFYATYIGYKALTIGG